MMGEGYRFQIGFLKEAFKVQPRASVNCLNSGRKYLYSSILLFEQYLDFPYNKDLSYNFNDTMVKFMDMCSFSDSVEGTILINKVASIVRSLAPEGSPYQKEI